MQKVLSPFLLTFLALTCLSLVVQPAWAAAGRGQAGTLDELVQMFDDESCRACHPEIFRQWESSWHARSVTATVDILREFIEVGLEQQWQAPLSRAQLLKCLHCHAPMVEFASEALAERIAGLAVAAAEHAGKRQGEQAMEELGRLRVGCMTCHNLRATTFLTGLEGRPEPGAVYGPTGDDSPGHESIVSPLMPRSLFCMQCHGTWVAPDGELMTCATIPGSYRHAYQGRGGARSCQDCHMKSEGRGHAMPGGHSIAMVREGLDLRVEVDAYRHLPGQVPGVKDPDAAVPGAAVTVFVENRAGHHVPDG